MKRTLKFFMMAAIVAAGFTACSSSEDDPVVTPADVKQSTLTISFANPSTYAQDDNASAAEVAANSVRIKVYQNGTQYIDTVATPTAGTGTNTWATLNIRVPQGTVDVYAMVNQGGSTYTSTNATQLLNTAFTTGPTTATAAFASMANLRTMWNQNLTSSTMAYASYGFPMFNQTYESINVVAWDGTTPTTNPNQLTIEVERMVGKVFIMKASTLSTAVVVNGVSLNVACDATTGLAFAMGGMNRYAYPFAEALESSNAHKDYNYDTTGGADIDAAYRTANFISEWDGITQSTNPSFGSTVPTIFVPLATGAYSNTNVANIKYATENTNTQKRKGESTFATIRTKFYPINIASYDGTNAAPTLTANTSTNYTGTTNYYLVQQGTNFYYFTSSTEADAYVLALNTAAGSTVYEVETYYGQYCYYYYYTKDKQFFRNNLYQITLNGISGIGYPTPEPPEEIWNQTDEESKLDVTLDIQAWKVETDTWTAGK